jgi:hypothetical protein
MIPSDSNVVTILPQGTEEMPKFVGHGWNGMSKDVIVIDSPENLW